MTKTNDVAARLARLIDSSGPISVAHYMAEANAHYYANRDPLGAAGDFTTAPEISQMFGELVGLWLADMWLRKGRPPARYVELGPGRGTLAADALRAMRSAGIEPPASFVETSPALRRAQASRVPHGSWDDDLAAIPSDMPLLAVANEFFDALPARQLVSAEGVWRELQVVHRDGAFERVPGNAVPAGAIPAALRDAPEGTVLETSPASLSIVRELARQIGERGGCALIIDYGHARTAPGDTLQAVSRHAFADPWQSPGDRDLTVHVDFQALAEAARAQGVRTCGPATQGEWLTAMGIRRRAAALAANAPDRADELAAARDRLTDTDQMGTLFKVLALVAPDWPEPAGFAR